MQPFDISSATGPSGVLLWDVTSGGKRFLLPAPSLATAATPFTVVLNWQAGLKK
jgi:hypothetical protein